MVESLPAAPPASQVDAQTLIDTLLYSVSHDLRSPLLTLSLSAELIAEALSDRLRTEPSGGAAVALNALQHGTRDLERMLQALASLSRARRRLLDAARAPLRLLLGGHVVISDAGDLDSHLVAVDALVVRELIDEICGEGPAEIHVTLTGQFAVLALPLPEGLDGVSGSPLLALAESLQRYAGTSLERLAIGQVLLEREGGALDIEGGRVRLWLADAGNARGRQ